MNTKEELKKEEEIFNTVIQNLSSFLVKNNYYNTNEDDLKNEIFLLVLESNQEEFYKSKTKYINKIKNEILKKYSNPDNKSLNNSVKTYLLEIGPFKRLTKEEEFDLFKRYKNGDLNAKKEIIERNLKLVVSVAKSYCKLGIPFLDIIQYGNIGLIKAIERFNPDLGFRFSTYAVHWIKQNISRSIASNESEIRIPLYVVSNILKIRKYEREYFQKNGKEISLKELSKILNIKEEEIKEIKSYNYDFTSLNNPINEEEELEVGDTISSNDDLDDKIIISSLSSEILKFFHEANLTKDQMIVISYRFGLTGEAPYSLEKVSKIIKKTKQSVKQIETKALLKLKKSSYKNNIKNYYDDSYDITEINKEKIKKRH